MILVYEAERKPQIMLPSVGARVVVSFKDCCCEGRILGIVAEMTYDPEEWLSPRVTFADGSVLCGFTEWEMM